MKYEQVRVGQLKYESWVVFYANDSGHCLPENITTTERHNNELVWVCYEDWREKNPYITDEPERPPPLPRSLGNLINNNDDCLRG